MRDIKSEYFFFFQAEDGIRDKLVTGVQTCALPIFQRPRVRGVGRLLQHAGVELEPGELAVEVVIRRVRRQGALGHGYFLGRDQARVRPARNARSNKPALRVASSSSIAGSRVARDRKSVV